MLAGRLVEQCAWFLRPAGALVAGLWLLSNPSPIVTRVQAPPELARVEFSFADDLERSLLPLLVGLADDA